MSRPIKLPLKSLQEVKKRKYISAAVIGSVIILLTILTAVKLIPSEESLNADIVALASLANGEKAVTVNPNPYYNVKVSADGETRSVSLRKRQMRFRSRQKSIRMRRQRKENSRIKLPGLSMM